MNSVHHGKINIDEDKAYAAGEEGGREGVECREGWGVKDCAGE